MRQQLLTAIGDGVLSRQAARAIVAEHIIDDAVRVGVIVPILPGVYARADVEVDRRLRQRAALAYVPGSALSHLDGLDRWTLLPAGLLRPDDPVQLTAAAGQAEVDVPGLRVTRRRAFAPEPPFVLYRDGDRVVRLEQAVIESWQRLPAAERRAPLIDAIRRRLTTAARMLSSLDQQPRAAGAAEMRSLLDLVGGGCHSELELWGHEKLFRHSQLRRARAQVPWDLPTGRIYLDRYFDVEMVDVELDGAAFHGDQVQRERDLVRDAMLGRLGILVVRYSHRRLMREPERVREELIAILETRRAQLTGVRCGMVAPISA